MNDTSPPKGEKKPITAKRQAILAGAFAQLRLSKKKIDPQILEKIRNIVKSSPVLMKTLGVTEDKPKNEDEFMPLSAKALKAESSQARQELKPKTNEPYEKIDQAKNMEVMAKLIELSPDNREAIKAVIKKSQD